MEILSPKKYDFVDIIFHALNVVKGLQDLESKAFKEEFERK